MLSHILRIGAEEHLTNATVSGLPWMGDEAREQAVFDWMQEAGVQPEVERITLEEFARGG